VHAYLLQEGTWEASGTYIDESGHESPCWGRRTIEHGQTWTVDSFLTVQGVETETFRSHDHVTPLRGDAASTEYSSESSELGTVRGRFTFVGDTIVGIGRAEQSDLLVVDALRRADLDRYESRGTLLSDGRLLSAWALTLTRQQLDVGMP
jgi:hypothetical protein